MKFLIGLTDTFAKYAKYAMLGVVFALISSAVLPVSAQTNGKSSSSVILQAQKTLSALGYWITKVDGKKDASTYHAIVAFQKVERRKRTGILNQTELDAMQTASRPAAKSAGAAHIEIDLTRQVIFLVDESGAVTNILPISSGTDKKYLAEGKWQTAHTPRGDFQITRQIFGLRRAPLGNLYYPNYFVGGVAVHGSGSFPVSPASHGCVRIPNFAAKEFQTLVTVGMPVSVYD